MAGATGGGTPFDSGAARPPPLPPRLADDMVGFAQQPGVSKTGSAVYTQ